MNKEFYKSPTSIGAILAIIGFLLPWVSLEPFISISGYEIPKVTEMLSGIVRSFSLEETSSTDKFYYILYFIPLLSIYLIYCEYNGSKKYSNHAKTTVFLLTAFVVYKIATIVNGGLLEIAGFGLWITVGGSVYLFIQVIKELQTSKSISTIEKTVQSVAEEQNQPISSDTEKATKIHITNPVKVSTKAKKTIILTTISIGLGYLLLQLFSNSNTNNSVNENSSTIDDFYSSSDFFKIDSTYSNVLIDGELFTIKVLSDKLDEHLEKYDEPEYDFDDIAPKTVVIYNNKTGKISYVNKFDAAESFLIKQCGDLSMEGKLYLHWMSYGGGSGFSSNTSLVFLEKGEIIISEIFESGQLDYILFNKNDKQIYVLKGIWGDEVDENGDPIETHFSEHRYKVLQYRSGYDGFEVQELGITLNRYSSRDNTDSALQLINEIIARENIIPTSFKGHDFIEFNGFNGKFSNDNLNY